MVFHAAAFTHDSFAQKKENSLHDKKSDKQMNTVKAEMSGKQIHSNRQVIRTNEPVQGQAAIYEPDSKRKKAAGSELTLKRSLI